MAAPGMRLTRLGKMILARGLTGENIHFTKVAIGDGDFDYEADSVFELTEMRGWRMDLPLTKVVVQGDGTVYIQAFLTNAEVYEGFAAREHAIFALDQETGAEVIYAYRNAGEEYDFIPSNTGPAQKNVYWEYIAEIQDAENVTAVLDLSVAYVGIDEFGGHIEAAHPHPNTPNHYLDVTEATHVWAADADNHLHKISVNNLGTIIKTATLTAVDTATTLSDEEIIFKARNELGLDANMLVVEDFTNPDTVDNFKIRITSSAENGSLLGVEKVDGLKTGARYIISDGVNQELVKIVSVVYNISGYHARLDKRLDSAYDFGRTYLFRTAYGGAEQRALTWTPVDGFRGVEANIARTLTFNTSLDKINDFEISGDGLLTADGFFTIAG